MDQGVAHEVRATITPFTPLRVEFVELESGVPLGEPHRVAVRAEAARPSWWRVWLDRRPVTAPIRLPGSERGWRAVATGESWNAGTGSCNALHFQFGEVGVLRPTWRWGGPAQSAVLEDPGYEVRDRTRTGFRAAPA